MYPDRDTLNNVSRSGYIAARDQSMVESGVTEGGKNTARFCQFSFSWMNTTTRAGPYEDLTETGNRARKVSGTQGHNIHNAERVSWFKIIS